MEEKYINPFTDFGFKRLFGEEPNKDILIDFLNELLQQEQGKIKKLTYLKTEQLGSGAIDRKAIFDLYCENEKGEKFIVELQKAKQNFFKDRSVFYSTFPIREQATKGDWSFELKAVYTIGILDFIFDEDKKDNDKFHYKIKLTDIETQKIFYDKLTFIYLEMPKFIKKENDLETHFDKWLYVLKNLHKLEKRPEKLQERIFKKLFQEAELAKLTPKMMIEYEDSLKYYRDIKNSLDTARDEGEKIGVEKGEKIGRQKGREEEKIEVAMNLIGLLELDIIAEKVGLSLEKVKKLAKLDSSN